MRLLRHIGSIFLLLTYLFGLGLQLGHPLLEHAEEAIDCHDETRPHFHGEHAHVHTCDLCHLGGNAPFFPEHITERSPVLFPELIAPLVLLAESKAKNTLVSYQSLRGPPALIPVAA